jgi:hypothetical protein
MKTLLIPILLAILTPAAAKTFDLANRFGVGAQGGHAFPIQGNDFDDFPADEVMWGLHARYHLTPADALQLNYSHYEFENTDINAQVYDLLYLNRINEGDKFTPILGLGAGVEYALTDDLVVSVYGDNQYVGKMPYNSEDEDDADEGFPGREIFAVMPQGSLTYYFGPDREIYDGKKKPAYPAPSPRSSRGAGLRGPVRRRPGRHRERRRPLPGDAAGQARLELRLRAESARQHAPRGPVSDGAEGAQRRGERAPEFPRPVPRGASRGEARDPGPHGQCGPEHAEQGALRRPGERGEGVSRRGVRDSAVANLDLRLLRPEADPGEFDPREPPGAGDHHSVTKGGFQKPPDSC